MIKDIKDYIHYYIGQNFTYGNGCPLYTLKGIMPYGSLHKKGADEFRLICIDADGQWDEMPLDEHFKLALRRLEDMTEEEAGEVFQLERNRNPEKGGHDFDLWREKYGFRITRFDLTEQHLMLGFRGELYWVVDVPKLNIKPANNYPLIFHYLLSKGFDLFSLIDSGAALDSKTLQPQQQ